MKRINVWQVSAFASLLFAICGVILYVMGSKYPHEFGVLAPRNQCMSSAFMCWFGAIIVGSIAVIEYKYTKNKNK